MNLGQCEQQQLKKEVKNLKNDLNVILDRVTGKPVKPMHNLLQAQKDVLSYSFQDLQVDQPQKTLNESSDEQGTKYTMKLQVGASVNEVLNTS